MNSIEEHIAQIKDAFKIWIETNNPILREAIERTVADGFFSQPDIEFQLQVLRQNLHDNDIEEWVRRSGLTVESNTSDRQVICLHAGNLPLVGFQTALGVILSGADYYGKFSRKDPYLLASFLRELQRSGLEQQINFSTDLNTFKNLKADTVVFAGSSESVPVVRKEINRLAAAKPDASYIIRTAKFSIAYLDTWNAEVRENLVEAVCRYGGKGCRSVAMVVAEFELEEVRGDLETSIQKFWDENPQHQKPSGELAYQYAYNEGIQRNQFWLEDFLIQETDDQPEIDFAVNWIKGNRKKAKELRVKFGNLVQSVYTTGREIEGIETEPLAIAQRPPLWWKPDGVDVIEALLLEIWISN